MTARIDGGLAQLVERLLCTEKVSGSNPLASRFLENVSIAVLCRSYMKGTRRENMGHADVFFV